MHWLIGNWEQLGATAGKAVLMYAAALLGLRVGERRTLAQWTVIDFVVAVAVGAIVGRTAVASTQSFITGAAAFATLVAAHRIASLARFNHVFEKISDHRIRVLVSHGQLRRSQLVRCAITEDDLASQLRQRGYFDLKKIRYVIYETKGSITVVPEDSDEPADPPLVVSALANAVGWNKSES